jgi:hypothetical protein
MASWNPEFTPSYTPQEMLEMGVFEGKYVNNIKGIPAAWKSSKKVLGPKDEPDETINFFGVKSRQPLSVWKANGWIKTDKNGWFEWFCHYWNGRRLGDEDDWQIGRWKSFVARHMGQIRANCKLTDKNCRPVQRQGLLQWGWDSQTTFTEEQCKKNLTKILNQTGAKLEDSSKECKILNW